MIWLDHFIFLTCLNLLENTDTNVPQRNKPAVSDSFRVLFIYNVKILKRNYRKKNHKMFVIALALILRLMLLYLQHYK